MPPRKQRGGDLPSLLSLFSVEQPSYIEIANANGQQVSFWTINDEDKMRELLLDGADGIITDNVRGAMKVFRDLGYKP